METTDGSPFSIGTCPTQEASQYSYDNYYFHNVKLLYK
jgi:hypothetical protein